MNNVSEISTSDGLLRGMSPLVQPVTADTLRAHAPATHLVVDRDGGLAGRCSIWIDGTPTLDGCRVGVIGHYAAIDSAAGAALLDYAVAWLRERRIAVAVGPMDGNTWRRYRLVTGRGDEPPFFMEPDNPDDWPGHFTGAGFAPIANYFSGLNADLTVIDPRVPPAMDRLAKAGVTIRPIRLENFEAELRAIYRLSLESFADNFLYTPISEDDFLAMYAPIRPHLRPELVLLAEQGGDGGELLGFMFGVPDLAEAQRGGPIVTAIAKSIAVKPGRSGAGLGSVLMDQFQQAARRLGYQRVMHALMHEGNRSRQMVARFGRPIRQYTLYSRSTSL